MRNRHWFTVLLVCGFAIAFLGCGQPAPKVREASSEASRFRRMADADVVPDEQPVGAQEEGKQAKEGGNANPPPAEKVKRKIKYTADVRLITDDFPKTEETLLELIDAHQGFLAFADVSTTPGQPRTGTWRARVPVEKFESFRRGIAKIGEVERNNVNTEDVTAQFYDLENHIKNKKAQEDALRELLKKTTDKMENLLAVQRELASVRDSIERSEGQLRLLANLSDLTTVTIRVQERRKFEPEKPPETEEKAAFGSRVGKTFTESWQGLVDFVQSLTIGIVALTPWLPVIAIVAAPFMILYRRQVAEFRRRVDAAKSPATTAQPEGPAS
jgi:hypothetical protein